MKIERTRGDTNPDICTITNARTRVVVNLAGCSFKLTVSSVSNPTDTSTQLYQIDGVITDAVNGVVEFAPTVDQVDRVGYYYYDIQMIDSYSKIITLTKDSYVYKQDITK